MGRFFSFAVCAHIQAPAFLLITESRVSTIAYHLPQVIFCIIMVLSDGKFQYMLPTIFFTNAGLSRK